MAFLVANSRRKFPTMSVMSLHAERGACQHCAFFTHRSLRRRCRRSVQHAVAERRLQTKLDHSPTACCLNYHVVSVVAACANIAHVASSYQVLIRTDHRGSGLRVLCGDSRWTSVLKHTTAETAGSAGAGLGKRSSRMGISKPGGRRSPGIPCVAGSPGGITPRVRSLWPPDGREPGPAPMFKHCLNTV